MIVGVSMFNRFVLIFGILFVCFGVVAEESKKLLPLSLQDVDAQVMEMAQQEWNKKTKNAETIEVKTKKNSNEHPGQKIKAKMSFELSSPFPLTWPPQNQQAIYFLYSRGRPSAGVLRDASYIGGIWGSITVDLGQKIPDLIFKDFGKISAGRTQSSRRRSLTAEEKRLDQLRPLQLITMSQLGHAQELKDYLCFRVFDRQESEPNPEDLEKHIGQVMKGLNCRSE